MGAKLLTLRSMSRRVVLVMVSLVTIAAQLGGLGLGAASATGSSLTYVDGTNEPWGLTGYPSSFSNASVRKGTLAVVGTDGNVYTANGVVPNLTNVVKAYVVESQFSKAIGFAIKADGSLWSWGDAQLLGRIHTEMTDDGLVQTDDPNPAQITGLPAITDVEIGYNHVLALDANGNVWSWGANESYQLGTNSSCTPSPSQQPVDNEICSMSTRYVPEQIQGLSNVKSISASEASSVAVTQSGAMMFWGTVCNIETSYMYYPTPSLYPGVGNDVKQALVDSCSITYLTNSGSVYTWGYAGAYPTEPKLVSALQNIESIATDGRTGYGYSNRIARDTNGIAYWYNASVISPHYASPVRKIGNIGPSSQYFSYNSAYGSNPRGGALVIDYVAPYPDEYLYLNSYATSGPVFTSILPDGTHQSSLGNQEQVNVSPDGSKLAYVQDCDIYTSDLDGTNEVNITNDSENNCTQYPIWSSDGSKLAYTIWPVDGSVPGINVMNADGSDVSTVMSDDGITGTPVSWSPDGTKLIFDHYPNDEQPVQIGVASINGSNIAYYAGNADNDWLRPVWSPDGNKIAFLSQTRDPYASFLPISLMVMDVDGSQLTTLYTTPNNVFTYNFAWAPNSQSIVFVKDVYNSSTYQSKTYLETVPASGGVVMQIADVSPASLDTIQWWHKPASTPTLAAPTNLNVPTPTKTPLLNWDAVDGASSYRVYRDGVVIATVTATTYTDTTATEGSHAYYVIASNGSIESAASNTAIVVVDKTRPTMSFASPTSFASPFTTGPTVTVNASDTSGLQSMAIHVYTNTNQLLTTCGSASAAQLAAGTMSCSLASLPNGTYYIKAGTFDAAGNNKTILSGSFTIQHN